MRQSTLSFDGAKSPQIANSDAYPPPATNSKETREKKKREPMRQSFNHGKGEHELSGGEEVSSNEEEVRLEKKGKRRDASSGEEESDRTDRGEGTEEEDEDDENSEEMMDLEAEDDEEYQSGDSLDEDEGGNSRRRKKKKSKGKAKERVIELESDDDSDSEVQIVTPKSQTGKKRRIVDSDDDEVIVEEPVASTSKKTLDRSSPLARNRSGEPSSPLDAHTIADLADSTDVDDDSTSDPDSSPPKRPNSSVKKSRSKKRAVESSDSDSPEQTQNKKKRQSQKRSRQDESESPKKKKKQPVKRKLKKLTQGTKDRRSADEASASDSDAGSSDRFIVDDDEKVDHDEWDESERERLLGEDAARKRRKEEELVRQADKLRLREKRLAAAEKKRFEAEAKAARVESEDADEEEEPVRSQIRKGKAKSKKSKSRKKRRGASSRDSEEEESDDLEILDEDTVLENRLRSNKSTVASRFEQIRAARANRNSSSQIVVESSDSESDSPGTQGARPSYMGNGDSDGEGGSRDEGSEVESGESDSEEEGDSDNFIVEDDDNDLGNAEAQVELDKLREGMRIKAQGLKFYIKTYLNYLVHLIVVPEANWLADSDFAAAKEKVESYLQGIINSSLSSAGWLPKFKKSLDTRPSLVISSLVETPACDACSAGKSRRATFLGSLSDPKYNRKTLQPLNSSDDSSNDSSSSSSSSSDSENDKEEETDFFGRKVSKTSKRNKKLSSKDRVYEYNLGKHCAGRAEVYHTFQHWPWHTKRRIEQKVLSLRDNSIRRAKKKKGMSEAEYRDEIRKVRRAREKDATKIASQLDRSGLISNLATTLENELERSIKAFSN
ncbi:uncharacterized protein JCM6883_003681 [Sporobolomyces salmoneus]|uniref:uncharacterized protein n=1 Tax=Sporobolomyces salmoneus TaxID=183962 RepID=UPI00316C5137